MAPSRDGNAGHELRPAWRRFVPQRTNQSPRIARPSHGDRLLTGAEAHIPRHPKSNFGRRQTSRPAASPSTVGREFFCSRQIRRASRPVVHIPVLAAAKFALHDAMLQAKVSNVRLAHLMGKDEKGRPPATRSTPPQLYRQGRGRPTAPGPAPGTRERHGLSRRSAPSVNGHGRGGNSGAHISRRPASLTARLVAGVLCGP
jgi:hypothetical protein